MVKFITLPSSHLSLYSEPIKILSLHPDVEEFAVVFSGILVCVIFLHLDVLCT